MKHYCLLPLLLASVATTQGAINIVLNYGSTSPEDVATYGPNFEAAESFWESLLTGYRDGAFAPTSVAIDITLGYIDGEGGTLGSAGPTFGNTQGSFLETSAGQMTFEPVDIDESSFTAVIAHEMAHVLGFGTLWSSSGAGVPGFQEVYVNGSGQYTGAAALAAFQIEFDQPGATFVPVELDGGAGTANGHWNMGIDLGENEVANSRDDPGDAIVYTSVYNGEVLDNDLMTGYLTGASVSQTTLQSFYDIGYEVVPEPSSAALLLGLTCVLQTIRRRRV
ncbi:MAG: PEP-CTERM sorting domain-containing protein [Opitutaceae bacterium]